jgi:transglutaminase-like putative cysteine protease
VRYTRDVSGIDTYQTPQRTLAWGIGDCDCLSILLAALLESVGYPVKLRVMETKGAGTWSHILPLVGMPPTDPTRWMPLDASVDEPAGWYPPKSIIVKTRAFDV